MSEKWFYGSPEYFLGKTEVGETVEISLSSLMNAKWDSSGKLIRVNSSLGSVDVIADSLEMRTTKELRAENERLTAERNTLRGRLEAEQQGYIGLRDAYENDTESLSNRLEHVGADFLECQRELSSIRAENDRLKSDLAAMTADRDSEQRWAQQYHDTAAVAQDEIERLRAALKEYSDDHSWGDCEQGWDIWNGKLHGWDIARAALAESGPK